MPLHRVVPLDHRPDDRPDHHVAGAAGAEAGADHRAPAADAGQGPARHRPPPAPPQSAWRRRARATRLAQVHDAEVLPAWSDPFARMLVRAASDRLPARATVLDVLCSTGQVTEALLRRGGEGVRAVAIDPCAAMLDVARERLAWAGRRRVFFRTESAEPRLHFDSDVYDLVVSNLGLWEAESPRALLAEMFRVAKPGAYVIATLPLRGTFDEINEMLAAALQERGLDQAARRLSALRARAPSAIEARGWLTEAGAEAPEVGLGAFDLLFAGARDLFFSPVIEHGPLPAWKEAIGAEQDQKDVFWQLKGQIDALCQGGAFAYPRPFSVTVRMGCLCGRKPLVPPQPEEVELNTAEIDVLSLLPKDPR